MSVEIQNINVDELQFEVVFEGDFFAKNSYPVIDPNGEKLIRDTSVMIATQFPEIHIRYYGNWGFVYDYLPGTDVFAIQIGDWHISAYSIENLSLARPKVDKKKIWEIDNFGSYDVEYYGVKVSQPNKFKNRQEQDTIVALLTKALLDFNHSPEIDWKRKKDGKALVDKDYEKIKDLMLKPDKTEFEKYEQNHLTVEYIIRENGPSEIAFSESCLENLKQGTWIES